MVLVNIQNSNSKYNMSRMLDHSWECPRVVIPSPDGTGSIMYQDNDKSYLTSLDPTFLNDVGNDDNSDDNHHQKRSLTMPSVHMDLSQLPKGTQLFTGTSFHNIQNLNLDLPNSTLVPSWFARELQQSDEPPSVNREYVIKLELVKILQLMKEQIFRDLDKLEIATNHVSSKVEDDMTRKILPQI